MSIIKATNITWHSTHVNRKDRERLLRQKGCTIWFTGLPSSGKSTTAFTLEHELISLGYLAYVLDGDNVRHGLNKNLGFSAEDREENIRRIGEVAKLFADAGVITMTSFISPYRRERDLARRPPPGSRTPLCRGLCRYAHRGVRSTRPQGPLRESATRRAERLHRDRRSL